MKIQRMITMVAFIILLIHLTAGGLVGFQSPGSAQNLDIEKIIPSEIIQNTLASGEQFEQNRSIFSTTTIISLIVAVMGIVAFRRNTYS